MQTHDEPPKHSLRPLFFILAIRNSGKQLGVFTPVSYTRGKINRQLRSGANSNGHVPGNSVSETGERMNGGAVIDDKSPEKEAILHNKSSFEYTLNESYGRC